MAIDTAQKRRAVAGLSVGWGITPDATPDEYWRASVGWGYAIEEAAVSLILDMPMQENAASPNVLNNAQPGLATPTMEGSANTSLFSLIDGPGGELRRMLHFANSGGQGGTPDYVAMNSTSISVDWSSGASIQFWAKREDETNNDAIFGIDAANSPRAIFSGGSALALTDDDATEAVADITSMNSEVLHYYAITRVGGDLTVFVDGVQYATFDVNPTGSNSFAAWGHDDNLAFSDMAMCGVMVYAEDRSQAQILTDMDIGKQTSLPDGWPTAFNLHFDNGTDGINGRFVWVSHVQTAVENFAPWTIGGSFPEIDGPGYVAGLGSAVGWVGIIQGERMILVINDGGDGVFEGLTYSWRWNGTTFDSISYTGSEPFHFPLESFDSTLAPVGTADFSAFAFGGSPSGALPGAVWSAISSALVGALSSSEEED